MRIRHTLSCLSLALVSTATLASSIGCGSGGSGSTSTGGSSAGVVLSPQSSIQTDKVGLLPAMPNTYFIVVDLEIQNHTEASVSLIPTLFSVQTTGGVQYTGDATTAADPKGCPANGSLAPGGEIECDVVFGAPLSAVTSEIQYNVPLGPTYSAPLTTTPCGVCADGCHDFSTDPANCGGCGMSAGAGQCVDGKPACASGATLCSGACVDISSDPQNCGKCGAAVAGGMTCVNGAPQCMAGSSACGGSCVAPSAFGSCCNAVCDSSGKKCQPGCTESYDNASQTCKFTLSLACDEVPPAQAMDPMASCTGDSSNMTCPCK